MTIVEQKKQLRTSMQVLLEKMSDAACVAQSQNICHKLAKIQQLHGFIRVAVFMPFSTEVDISSVSNLWDAQGISLYVPAQNASGQMEMVQPAEGVVSLKSSSFSTGFYTGNTTTQPWEDSQSAVLVPGLAFSPDGARLGRGKGFYDVWLKDHDTVHSFGVCFAEQVVARVPVTFLDCAVREVVAG